MCNKKLVVAVIDSGVDLNTDFFKEKDIKSIKIDSGKVIDITNDNNTHGTTICARIYKECKDIKMISIQVLNKNNKSSLEKVINAINYCIDNHVDIINLSLGFCGSKEKIDRIREVCDKAIENKIVIFAAHNNEDKVAYPASFHNVIGVDYDGNIKEKNFYIDKKLKNIFLSQPKIDIKKSNYTSYSIGNSILCPYIVGIFCSYINYFKLNIKSKNIQAKFLDFIESMERDYRYKIFNLLEKDIYNKESLFYPMNSINKETIDSYDGLFNIVDYCKEYELIEKYDLFIIGILDKIENCNGYGILYLLKKYKKDIFMKYAYINTFERYLYSKETSKNINCQYL